MARIIVPVDYSASARNAMNWACHFNKVWRGELIFLRVKEVIHGVEPLPDGVIEELEQREARLEIKAMERMLSSIPQGETCLQDRISYEVCFGNRGEEIIEFSKRKKAEWIILGVREKHRFYERLFGTVSTFVLKQSPCPVIFIPEKVEFAPPKRIALASDMFLSEEESYDRLKDIAEAFDSQIERVFVNEVDSGSLKQKEEVFKAITEKGVRPFPARVVMIRDTSVLSGLDYFVRTHDIDMMAVYMPHRDWMDKLIHPSFSRKLLFHTSLPLLFFREEHCN